MTTIIYQLISKELYDNLKSRGLINPSHETEIQKPESPPTAESPPVTKHSFLSSEHTCADKTGWVSFKNAFNEFRK
jgi:hypothetical protein